MYRDIPKFQPDEILVYLRKSRSDDPSLTVEEVLQKHESVLREWIEHNLNSPIPEENWFREVVSGETIAGRPEMQKVLKQIESPKRKAILTVEVQRLSRGDLEDCGRLMKLLRYTHTYVITPMKIYDLEDEYDRDGFERELKRGNDYLEYFKKIQKRGKQISVQEGNFTGGLAPYGYEKIKVTVGKKKCPTLAIVEEDAKVVRMIFDWYGNKGYGSERISQMLNDMGIRSPKGTTWKKSTISKMLENEAYIGKIRRGCQVSVHTVIDQEIIKGRRYNRDYEVYDGKHDAIIDEELFYRIKNKKSSLPKCKRTTKLNNPLASMSRCSCGTALDFKFHRGKFRYVCPAQVQCHNSSVLYTDVMDRLIEILKQCIEDFTVAMNNNDNLLYEQHQEQIALLETKFAEAEKKEISLWEKYSEDGMPKSVFDTLRARCEEEKKTLESALVKAYSEMPTKVDYQEKILAFHEAIETINDDAISANAKNKLLRNIIERIVITRPQAVRMPPAEALEKGIVTENGWYTPEFEMDVTLLI